MKLHFLKILNRICAIFIIISLNGSTIYAQQYPNLIKPNKVTTIPYFSNGDAFNYHVTSEESVYKNEKEKPSSNTKMEYDVAVKVTDSTEHQYTFELTYSGFKASEESKKDEIDVKNIMDGVTVRYQTDEIGIFDTITNLAELSVTMEKTINLMTEKLAEKIKDEEARQMLKGKLEMMKLLLLQPENLEVMFLEDILRLHAFNGFELTLNQPLELAMEFPILENLSLQGTGTITLKSIDKLNNKCQFECVEKPNPGEITKFIEYIAMNIFPEALEKMKDKEKELKEIRYTTNIKVNYTMELSSGMMKSIKSTNKTNVTNGKKSTKTVSSKEYKLK